MSTATLPAGFEDLAPLLDWNLASMDERRNRRADSPMGDIDAFYQAILPRMDAILEHLATVEMADDMDPASATLLNLALSLCEVAPAVEQFFEPTISYGYDTKRFAQGSQ
ncbi:MAG: hypothetical protein ACR2N9_07485 [Acidimicrobiia bacterium]